MMSAYVGRRRRGELVVTRRPEDTELTPDRGFDLANHSPSGFEVGYLAGLVPDVSGVVVGDVPEFAGTPLVPVERFRYLLVVADCRSMGAVDVQHAERLYRRLYLCIL